MNTDVPMLGVRIIQNHNLSKNSVCLTERGNHLEHRVLTPLFKAVVLQIGKHRGEGKIAVK